MAGTMRAGALAARFIPVGLTRSWPAGGGPLIGRRAARELARRELARSIYQPGIWQRFLAWLSRLLNGAGSAVPGGWFGLVTLAVLAVLVVSGVIFWVRPVRSRRTSRSSALAGKLLRAQDHRRDAERRAAAGDYSGAIVERVRAIAAELEERGVVSARPGRTADELAAEAGRELPAHRSDLRGVMYLFDDVRYGDRDGTRAGYQQVSALDTDLRSARPTAGTQPQPAIAGSAVPR
jgi:type II secretory pathway pseudopilin PulG